MYRSIIKGVNAGMNVDFEEILSDEYKKETMVVEIAVQQLMEGYTLDTGNIELVLRHEHWRDMLRKYTRQYI